MNFKEIKKQIINLAESDNNFYDALYGKTGIITYSSISAKIVKDLSEHYRDKTLEDYKKIFGEEPSLDFQKKVLDLRVQATNAMDKAFSEINIGVISKKASNFLEKCKEIQLNQVEETTKLLLNEAKGKELLRENLKDFCNAAEMMREPSADKVSDTTVVKVKTTTEQREL